MLESNDPNAPMTESSVLRPDTQARIIEKADAVYSAYSLLDRLNHELCTIRNGDDRKLPIALRINEMIQTQCLENTIQIDRIDHTVICWAKSKDTYQVDIIPNNKIHHTALQTLLKNHTLTACLNPNNDRYLLSTSLTKGQQSISIGGSDKILLYPLHLINLQSMIRELSDSRNKIRFFIAMSTGSGKSFTQALWFLTLWLADVKGIFTAPEELVIQLHEDFKKLLPIEVMRDIQPITRAEEELGKWSILPASMLLTQKWGEITPKKEEIWLAFDEIDKIQNELETRRILEILSDIYPLLWIGATPSKPFYEKSQSIISLSPKEKEILGISAPIDSNQVITQSVIEKTNHRYWFNTILLFSVLTNLPGIFLEYVIYSKLAAIFPIQAMGKFKKFALNGFKHSLASILAGILLYPPNQVAKTLIGKKSIGVLSRLMVTIHSLFEPESSSIAHEYVDTSELTFTSSPRQIVSPIGLSALLLTEDKSTIINLSLIFEGHRALVYTNGKFKSRYQKHDKAQLGKNAGTKRDHSYEEAHRILRIDAFWQSVKKQNPRITKEALTHLTNQTDFSDTTHYLEFRVLHGLINLSLACLTGYELIELNRERQNNLPELLSLARRKLQHIPSDLTIRAFLEKQSLSELLVTILLPLIQIILVYLGDSKEEKEILERIVDNWPLDKQLHLLMKEGDPYLILERYCQDQTQIPNSIKPALSEALNNEDYPVALEIIRTSIEAMNNQAPLRKLYSFCHQNKVIFNLQGIPYFKFVSKTDTIVYKEARCPYTQAEISALVRLGLTTLCDRSKLYGFNSAILHVALFPKQQDAGENSVTEEIQAYGRLRGLDKTQAYFFFNCYAEKSPSQQTFQHFLHSKNFYPTLLIESEKQQKQLTKRQGVDIAQQLLTALAQEPPLASLGDNKYLSNDKFFKDQSDEILHQAFSMLYNRNHHQLAQTKIDCKTLLETTRQHLYAYEQQIKTKQRSTLGLKVSFEILGFLSRATYYLYSAPFFLMFLLETHLSRTKDQNALTYAHIIRHYNLFKLTTAYHTIQATVERINILPPGSSHIPILLAYPAYQDSVHAILKPFIQHQDHLECLLNRLYSKDSKKENEHKAQQIIEFTKQPRSKAFCHNAVEISQWMQTLSKEIYQCHQHYANLSPILGKNAPHLYKNHQFFKIQAPYTPDLFESTVSNLSSSYLKIVFGLVYFGTILVSIIVIPVLFSMGFSCLLTVCFPAISPIIVEIGASIIQLPILLFLNFGLHKPEKLRDFLLNLYPEDNIQKINNELTVLLEQDRIHYMKSGLFPYVETLGKQFITEMSPLTREEIESVETQRIDNIHRCLGPQVS